MNYLNHEFFFIGNEIFNNHNEDLRPMSDNMVIKYLDILNSKRNIFPVEIKEYILGNEIHGLQINPTGYRFKFLKDENGFQVCIPNNVTLDNLGIADMLFFKLHLALVTNVCIIEYDKEKQCKLSINDLDNYLKKFNPAIYTVCWDIEDNYIELNINLIKNFIENNMITITLKFTYNDIISAKLSLMDNNYLEELKLEKEEYTAHLFPGENDRYKRISNTIQKFFTKDFTLK